MPSNQQRRDAAKRHLQRQNERRAAHARSMRQRWTIIGVVVIVLAAIGIVWASTSGSDQGAERQPSQSDAYGDGSSGDAAGTETAAGDSATTEAPSSEGSTDDAAALCDYPATGQAAKPVNPPVDLNPPTEGEVTATIALGTGDVVVELDRSTTPCTTNSFISLADQGYYNDITCHRLTASASLKVLQCGDPSGSGAGGPGYSFADELSGNETYQAGVLAMANAGPNTNGSQFFLVYGDSMLHPDYTVFGHITAGMDVLDAIAAKGIAGGGQDGAPADPVTIESVTVAG